MLFDQRGTASALFGVFLYSLYTGKGARTLILKACHMLVISAGSSMYTQNDGIGDVNTIYIYRTSDYICILQYLWRTVSTLTPNLWKYIIYN